MKALLSSVSPIYFCAVKKIFILHFSCAIDNALVDIDMPKVVFFIEELHVQKLPLLFLAEVLVDLGGEPRVTIATNKYEGVLIGETAGPPPPSISRYEWTLGSDKGDK